MSNSKPELFIPEADLSQPHIHEDCEKYYLTAEEVATAPIVGKDGPSILARSLEWALKEHFDFTNFNDSEKVLSLVKRSWINDVPTDKKIGQVIVHNYCYYRAGFGLDGSLASVANNVYIKLKVNLAEEVVLVNGRNTVSGEHTFALLSNVTGPSYFEETDDSFEKEVKWSDIKLILNRHPMSRHDFITSVVEDMLLTTGDPDYNHDSLDGKKIVNLEVKDLIYDVNTALGQDHFHEVRASLLSALEKHKRYVADACAGPIIGLGDLSLGRGTIRVLCLTGNKFG